MPNVAARLMFIEAEVDTTDEAIDFGIVLIKQQIGDLKYLRTGVPRIPAT